LLEDIVGKWARLNDSLDGIGCPKCKKNEIRVGHVVLQMWCILFWIGAGMAGSHLKFGKNEGPDESITEKCSGPSKVHN
jgi:hypothetical protein